MGRPRKPVHEHIKAGTYRADRHGPLSDDVPAEASAPPVKPADLDAEASAVWDELLPFLSGRAREADASRLADLCRYRVILRKNLAALGMFEPGTVGYNRASVTVGIFEDKVNNIAKQFGLTPESRAKLKPEVAAGPVAARVPTRPKTALDRRGKPK